MAQTPKRKPRWLRFSLRGTFVLVTLLCVWLGMEVSRVRRQEQAVAKVLELGGGVFFADQFDPKRSPQMNSGSMVPHWLRQAVGEKFFRRVVTVNFNLALIKGTHSDLSSDVTDEGLALLYGTPHLRELHLGNNRSITDQALVHVPGLKRLRVIVDPIVKTTELRK